MTTPDLPHGLPPLPPVPAGFDRWEYRGQGFTNDHKPCAFAYAGEGMDTWIDDDWEQYIDATPNGDECGSLHYLEAVREPAEVAEGYEEDVMPGGHTIIRKIAEVPASGVEAPVCDLERKLAEAREALEWAQSQLGKHTRPSPIDKALASINRKGTP